jgi:hypothetical protein
MLAPAALQHRTQGGIPQQLHEDSAAVCRVKVGLHDRNYLCRGSGVLRGGKSEKRTPA